jgi:hypothetical protein
MIDELLSAISSGQSWNMAELYRVTLGPARA